jgi:hypothetical protein
MQRDSIERSSALASRNFKLERQCEKCRRKITLGKSFAELVLRITSGAPAASR